MTHDESRQVAQKRLADLIALLQKMPAVDGADDLVVEGEGLRRSIDAFHLEGIRFRMYRMDRLLHRVPGLPAEAMEMLADVRTALEAAGCHPRSH